MNDDRYVRVYYTIRTDPKFESVYGDDASLATWLRLLLDADAVWPSPASIPKSCRASAFKRLVSVGIVDALPGHLYRIHGLDAERDKRSQSGRNASAVRWHSGRNADPMPSKSPSPSPNKAESESEQDDPVQTYWTLTTRTPRGGALDWCKRLGDRFGFAATTAAMTAAWSESDDIRSLLSRTEDRLVLDARHAEMREMAEERERLRQKRARPPDAVETPDPQRVSELMDEVRKRLGGGDAA